MGIDQVFDSVEAKGEVFKVEGVQFAIAGNCVGSGFNKPEALYNYVKIKKLNPKHVVFVDDVANHCINMCDFWRDRKIGDQLALTSLWWPIDVPKQFLPSEQTPEAIDRFEKEKNF